ncbi:MAG: hypothetical protein COB17_00870 [Sulfurimonas sp.]|nr:MAG: hypothetical protein COB17_00870 [Sulfurimonas sp.]
MLPSYKPLITVKQASNQLGLKVSELNKLIADKVIETSHRGSNTLYVCNLSLAIYKAKSYKVAVKEAIHEAKVDKIFEKYNLLIAIEENTLPLTYQPAYDKERAKLKKAISETVDSFLSLSDTEYKQFLEKPLSDIIDTTELRNLIDMAKGGSTVFKNPSNTEILSMGAIIEKFNTNNTLLKKLLKKGFTAQTLDKYFEQDSETLKAINKEGIAFDIFNYKNIEYVEFFKTYKSIKLNYNTKIAYPLDKSVIADIETELREKFHINLLDKGGK